MTREASASNASWIAQSRWPRLLGLTLLGTITGAISAIGVIPFTPPENFGLLLIFVLPGLAFGAVIGPALAYGG